MTGRLTAVGSTLALAGALHAALNARLMRQPDPLRAAPDSDPGSTWPLISVLVPARDEATAIGACLASLRGQTVAEVLVLDDESTDGTADVVRAAGDPRVRLLPGRPTPEGWLGKPHACAQLAAAADPRSDVLVFLDADVRLEPGAITSAVAMLDAHGLDLVSPHPRQVTLTPAERLVQPLLQWSILTTLPLRLAERSRRPSLAAANGQFIAVRRSSYDRAGGHRPAQILDDIALARAVQASGGRVAIVNGSSLAWCRMYEGWPQLRYGYTKSLWAAFGSPPKAALVMGTLAVAYIAPPLAALRGSRLGLVGYLAAVVSRVISARATGGRALPDSLAHPASVALAIGITARSHRERRRGTLSWRGRRVG